MVCAYRLIIVSQAAIQWEIGPFQTTRGAAEAFLQPGNEDRSEVEDLERGEHVRGQLVVHLAGGLVSGEDPHLLAEQLVAVGVVAVGAGQDRVAQGCRSVIGCIVTSISRVSGRSNSVSTSSEAPDAAISPALLQP